MKLRGLVGALGCAAALLFTGSCGDTTSDLVTRAEGPMPETACQTSQECSEPTPRCDNEAGICRGCLEPSDCGDGQICVLPVGSCAEPCTVGDCPTANPICDLTSGLCRGCASDAECSEELPVCDESSGRCVECASAEECGGDEPFCSGGRCVECLEPGHCHEQGEGCSPVGECAIPCAGPSDCNLFDDPICDSSGYCVECLSPADCEDGETCVGSDCEDLDEQEGEREDDD